MGRNLRKLLLGFAFSPPSTPSALNAARPLTLTVVKIRNKKKTFSFTDNYFKPSREALSKSCKIIFHHATRGETDDGNEKLDRSVGDGKSHKVFTPSTKWQLRLSHQKEKQRKNFDVEMEGKISFFALCGNLLFTLFSFAYLGWQFHSPFHNEHSSLDFFICLPPKAAPPQTREGKTDWKTRLFWNS